MNSPLFNNRVRQLASLFILILLGCFGGLLINMKPEAWV